jgi:hypothetical protein
MGATYLSMQLRTTDRAETIVALRALTAASTDASVQFYIAESFGGWLPVYPSFTPELEHTAKTLSARLKCLLVLLLSADEDDLYCVFFRDGKQLPWFKIAAGRSRRGKERDKLATKLEALSEVCNAESRGRLVTALSDATEVHVVVILQSPGLARIRPAVPTR